MVDAVDSKEIQKRFKNKSGNKTLANAMRYALNIGLQR
jgi:hypothetical protein